VNFRPSPGPRSHDGKLEENSSIDSVRSRDTGTLQYDWFFSDEATGERTWSPHMQHDGINATVWRSERE